MPCKSYKTATDFVGLLAADLALIFLPFVSGNVDDIPEKKEEVDTDVNSLPKEYL